MDPVLLADKFKLITQNVHLNPLLTEVPIKITKYPEFTPLYTLLSPNYVLLDLPTLLNRIPNCALNFVTHQTLKIKLSPLLSLIRHEHYASGSKSNLVKPEKYLPSPPQLYLQLPVKLEERMQTLQKTDALSHLLPVRLEVL